MDLRATVLGILGGNSFLASLGNDVLDQTVTSFSSHSLLVLADPRHSRLIRGGFSHSFLHKIPPDSPMPCFMFWLLICSHLHSWKGRVLCFLQAGDLGHLEEQVDMGYNHSSERITGRILFRYPFIINNITPLHEHGCTLYTRFRLVTWPCRDDIGTRQGLQSATWTCRTASGFVSASAPQDVPRCHVAPCTPIASCACM
jgi:hypothetical protein